MRIILYLSHGFCYPLYRTIGDDPDYSCPVCNKLMIIKDSARTKEAGVAFQCPFCYEWLRFKKVSDNMPPNLTEEEAKRWHIVEIIRLDKEEVEKMSRRIQTQKYLNGKHNSRF